MKGSDLFAKCLESEGIQYIFGVPGEENMDLLDSLLSSKIKFICTRHEQGAAFMANIHGRFTGRVGVCLGTLGPGATNLVTGIADANLDRSPLLAITAQASLQRIHKETHQYVDILSCFKPLTKWNARIEKSTVIPEVVRKAVRLAEMEKPGACHIELPEDIAEEEAKGTPISPERIAYPVPDSGILRKAADLINKARHPIILTGNGVIRGRATDSLRRFATAFNIPVAHTFMGNGAMPCDSDLSLFTIGLQQKDYINCGFDKSDLIIAVGYDFVEYAPSHWNPRGQKKVIHIDYTPSEVDDHYPVVAELVGEINGTLSFLSELAKDSKEMEFSYILRDYILGELEEASRSDGFPVKPQRIIADLREVMRRDDIVISDVGAHKIWLARMYPTYEPDTLIITNGFSAMGIALPGAITAKLLYPEKKVVAVCGDGGFMMTCQELETACRLGLPIVVLIFKDNGYGLIKWKQLEKFGRECGVSFGNPDFVQLANSFGAKGYRVEAASELKSVLAEALEQKVPAVIDVPVDYSENMRLTERLGRLICVV